MLFLNSVHSEVLATKGKFLFISTWHTSYTCGYCGSMACTNFAKSHRSSLFPAHKLELFNTVIFTFFFLSDKASSTEEEFENWNVHVMWKL